MNSSDTQAPVRLTKLTKASGCAAKIGPKTLSEVLSALPKFSAPELLVGLDTSDDAAVWKISDELAVVETLDFFTPVVDDPYLFGKIAATNALSDVYAMGGEPKFALNIVGFPSTIPPKVLQEIMTGGADRVKEAGAVLVGGHSITNDDPIYGLAVTGFVHPDKVRTNAGAKPGDVLLLTKQLGVGIINTAVKAEMATAAEKEEAILVMSSLNAPAKNVMDCFTVHACTDVTGFGLIGHSFEMAKGSGVTIELDVSGTAFLSGAKDYAGMGLIPGGAYRNREFVGDNLDPGSVEEVYLDLLFDPQTSGGLLFSIPEKECDAALSAFEHSGIKTAVSVVGKVLPEEEKLIRVV
ncbi:MAG: selenide, water dikinase SelD [Lachnospiraceae bacterium]|nr:selenide, water dikinase SelD [Lachnospiraceae bacterium]